MQQVFFNFSLTDLEPVFKDWVKTALSEMKPANTSNSDTEQPLTILEAAQFLHLSKQTIYGLVSKGQIPHMKRGKILYFSKVELLEYLKAGRKKTISETEGEAESYLKIKRG